MNDTEDIPHGECPECEDTPPGASCPVCLTPRPEVQTQAHDVETRTPAPVWVMAPRGDA